MKKIKVAVLAGGSSSEKDISLRSGENIYQAIKKAGFEASLYDPMESHFTFTRLKDYDLIYPILHGTKGEDGCIQGILEFYNYPYIGCDILTSAITMNKYITKQIFNSIEIPCAKGFVTTNNLNEDLKKINQLGYPIFIKPVSEGSSIGALVLHNEEEAKQKLPKHLQEFPHSLVEEYIQGREMTIGVIERDNNIIILPILELKPKDEFYSFTTKYTKGMTEFILPAKISDNLLQKIHLQVKKIFTHFSLKDCIRIDFILTSTGPVYLEINTAPGMTITSDIPAMLESIDIKMTDFVTNIIQNNIKENK